MKNFWLDRKAEAERLELDNPNVSNRGIRLQSVSGHTFVMNDEETLPPWNCENYQGNDFVDLSHTTQHNNRYKEYDRLNKHEKKWKRVEMLSNTGFLLFKDDAMKDETNNAWAKATEPFDFGNDLDNEIEKRRQALVTHQKNYEKASGDDLKGLNKWLKEYEKLCEAFEEVYQKKHPIPGKEYTFTAKDGTKFKGKFQEAQPSKCKGRCYPYEVIEDAINMYKEKNGSGK